MNGAVQYFALASVALILFAVGYLLLLRGNSNIRYNRVYLLVSLMAAPIVPLVHIGGEQFSSLPFVGNVLPAVWLQPVLIGGASARGIDLPGFPVVITWIYWLGFVLFTSVLVFRISRVLIHLKRIPFHSTDGFKIFWSDDTVSSFSFFHYIFIGQANTLNADEKKAVLAHEKTHANQLHSIDKILLEIIQVILWFNPVLILYRGWLLRVHEFEADRNALSEIDRSTYCALLARTALRSLRMGLAVHFNNSITLKRIAMINKMNHHSSGWRLVVAGLTFLGSLVFVACQDQASDQPNEKDITYLDADFPDGARSMVNALEQEHPGSTYRYLLVDRSKVDALRAANPEGVFIYSDDAQSDRTGLIVRSDIALSVPSATDPNHVYSIVDEAAQPVGGMPKFYDYVAANLTYPAQARREGIEGRVFVKFVVNQDGTISDAKIVKGIGAGCDAEALRVVQQSSAWTPAKVKGEAVAMQMVLPIIFALK